MMLTRLGWLLCLHSAAAAAYATSYYVDLRSPDDSGDGTTPAVIGPHAAKQTFQAGLNLCGNGDTVNVAAGTYTTTPPGRPSFVFDDANGAGCSVVGNGQVVLQPTG